MKRHHYTSALVVAGVLFVIGGIIVVNRSGTSYTGNPNALNIDGVIQGTGSAQPIPAAPPPQKPVAVDVPYTNVTAPANTTSTETPKPTPDTTFDWNSFITALSHPSAQTGGTSQNNGLSEAYSFIPTGLFSPPKPQSALDMPDSEKPLYAWGQSAGEAILSFEDSHPNQPQILTDFIQDRQNPTKINAMKQLGADLSMVGDNILNIDSVPQMATAGKGLANAYHEIGQKLAAIPDAKGDEATAQAILTYDKSADAFVQKFVNVVNILQANGVKYAQNEPGAVFMFPSSQ